MGAAASTSVLEDKYKLSLEETKALAGDRFDQAKWNEVSEDGAISKEQWEELQEGKWRGLINRVAGRRARDHRAHVHWRRRQHDPSAADPPAWRRTSPVRVLHPRRWNDDDVHADGHLPGLG